MTLISKEIYDKRIILEIDPNSKTVLDITNKVNAAIDEIANYQPLYSTRKNIERLGSDYAIEHMKKVAAAIIKIELGD